MMPMMRWAGLLLVGLLHPDRAGRRSAEAGAAKAAVCFACHGPNGNSVNAQWPNPGRPERGLHRGAS